MEILKQKLAIPTSNGVLDAHFGHCKQFTLISIVANKVLETKVIDAPPHEPNLLPGFLAELDVTDVIAGGMGQKAIHQFNSLGVNVMVGAPEKAPADLAKAFVDGTITYTGNYCNH